MSDQPLSLITALLSKRGRCRLVAEIVGTSVRIIESAMCDGGGGGGGGDWKSL